MNMTKTLQVGAGLSREAKHQLFCVNLRKERPAVDALAEFAGAHDGEIVAVTQNVQYGQRYNLDTGANAGIDALATARAVARLGAPIVFLQELCPTKLADGVAPGGAGYPEAFPPIEEFEPWLAFEQTIADEFPHLKFVYAAARPSSMYNLTFGNGLLIDTRKCEVLDEYARDQLLEPVDGDPEGRSVACAHVKVDGQHFVVAGLHLTERQPPGYARGERQTNMMRAALNAVEVYALRRGVKHTILGGDFNVNHVSALTFDARELSMKDVYLHPEPGCSPQELASARGYTHSQGAARARGVDLSTGWNGGCIDGVMVSKGLAISDAVTLAPHHAGGIYSDHRGVAIAFKAKH